MLEAVLTIAGKILGIILQSAQIIEKVKVPPGKIFKRQSDVQIPQIEAPSSTAGDTAQPQSFVGTKTEMSNRFAEYIALVREYDPELPLSRLAEVLGYEDSDTLESLFVGNHSGNFAMIDDFCHRALLSSDWLKHGNGAPFYMEGNHFRYASDIKGLLAVHSPRSVYFVRSLDPEGALCLVFEHSDYRWSVFRCTMHFSGVVGGTGRAMLVDLYKFLKEPKYASSMFFNSRSLPPETFSDLACGRCFPAYAIQPHLGTEYWHEDFTILDTTVDYSHYGQAFLDAQREVRHALKASADRQ